MKLLNQTELGVAHTLLQAGKVLAYPTETSFGLGCDATNQEAVNRIFAIKGRDPNKPLLVVVADLEDIKPFIIWDERLEVINKKYWPGPLTVIVSAKIPSELADGIISVNNEIAFRVTSHPIARELVQVLGRPLVSTSANKAGEPSLFSSQDIAAKFSSELNQPDGVIEDNLPEAPGSTIIKLIPDGFEVVRQGTINFSL